MFAIKKDSNNGTIPWLCYFPELGYYMFSSLETMLLMAQKNHVSIKLFYDLPEAQKFISDNPKLFDNKTIICKAIIEKEDISFMSVLS